MHGMDKRSSPGLGRAWRPSSRNSLPHPTEVRPYGRFGVGLLTGHPVGLLIVAAVVVLILWRLSEARWFFAGSVLLGVIFGLALWLYHR
jgi:hypothetical protein